MDIYAKIIAAALVAVVLNLVLKKQGKDMALLLSVLVVCLVIGAAVTFLSPMVSFLGKLETLGNLDHEMLSILLKGVGIGLLADLSELVCTDAGEAAIGKAVRVAASAVILWMSLPMFEALLALVERVLEGT